jgi:fructose-bisphosphate aldolase class II
MTLVSIANQLRKAHQEGYAVPLFNIFDIQGAEGMFAAVEEKRAPVIAGIYSALMEKSNAHAFAAYLRQRAADASVPVSVMLDHGASFELCIKAISYGFTDVMYDGSRLPLEENIANTQMVVRAAHAVGVGVEAELGHVGSGSDYPEVAANRLGFTDPEMAEHFAAETGIDILAVAIGNAHGIYRGDPFIDMELLSAIRSRVSQPLALHGGSGISEEQFRAAISGGIAKINLATDLYVLTAKRLAAAFVEREITYFDMIPMVAETFHERCCYFLDLFGASGKAGK